MQPELDHLNYPYFLKYTLLFTILDGKCYNYNFKKTVEF